MVKMPNVSVVAETMELRSVIGAYQRDMDVIAALEQIEIAIAVEVAEGTPFDELPAQLPAERFALVAQQTTDSAARRGLAFSGSPIDLIRHQIPLAGPF